MSGGSLVSDVTAAKAGAANRWIGLDALRGLAILCMILVNNPGDWGHVYAPLLHAQWHGCTPTDLVFPFFLFIVGVSIALGLLPRVETGAGLLSDGDRVRVVGKTAEAKSPTP